MITYTQFVTAISARLPEEMEYDVHAAGAELVDEGFLKDDR